MERITVRNLIGQHSKSISCNMSFIWQCDEGLIGADFTTTVSGERAWGHLLRVYVLNLCVSKNSDHYR
jgi:hypothetical protein